MSSNLRLFLRSVTSRHPDVPLPDGKAVDVGRDRETTRLKDTRLSRRQLTVTADYSSRSVRVLVRGGNPSCVDGERAPKGAARLAPVGATLELLEGRHCYVVGMDGSDERTEEERKGRKVSAVESGGSEEGKKGFNHWSQGLLAAMNDPAQILDQDESLVVIRDRFPKARQHYLVLPKERIHELRSLESHHVGLLKKLHSKGLELAGRYPGSEFKMGYHAVPSMTQVHLHVISQDFDSESLKHKKHWNSFNSEYFVPSETVLSELEREGDVSGRLPGAREAKELLARELCCHKCEYKPRHLPDLKKHVVAEHFPRA